MLTALVAVQPLEIPITPCYYQGFWWMVYMSIYLAYLTTHDFLGKRVLRYHPLAEGVRALNRRFLER